MERLVLVLALALVPVFVLLLLLAMARDGNGECDVFREWIGRMQRRRCDRMAGGVGAAASRAVILREG